MLLLLVGCFLVGALVTEDIRWVVVACVLVVVAFVISVWSE